MSNIKDLIRRESKVIDKLHSRIHETFLNRNKDLETWKRACSEFHTYLSPMDSYIEKIYDDSLSNNAELIEFGISFLELNPMFFRSGYIKEELLRKLKQASLSPKQIIRLLGVLVESVENRGYREYRGYCRLAAFIADKKLIHTLECMANSEPNSRTSRAKLMLAHIQQAHNQGMKWIP